ncbi:SDR family oxidoreductase [Saliphagus infecundisoli]|uniref:SDR family oxidoreductase n=1 Tax=Saliphagus infecundisoli TaxID=1849069 RepID=A0ABD5QMH5_9EURY|nr:NAD(P)-dependent oxidoreductase [Saliphagus infecundisoli]
MNVLVLGANGLVGSNVVGTALDRKYSVAGTYHSTSPDFPVSLYQHDIRDADEFEAILAETNAEVVINCAAMTDVDGCEQEPDIAHEINEVAPGRLASMCADRDVTFVHLSTDYVFDGTDTEPYDEDASVNPIQEYGRSKLEGERAVEESSVDGFIARLSFVYGVHGATNDLTGFPAWVRDQLSTNSAVPLFTDQFVTPSRAGQVATTLFDLIESEARETVHIASRSCVTPFEFGSRICDVAAGDSTLLRESSMDDLEREAPRPTNTCLDVSTVESALGRSQPTLTEDLQAIEESFRA